MRELKGPALRDMFCREFKPSSIEENQQEIAKTRTCAYNFRSQLLDAGSENHTHQPASDDWPQHRYYGVVPIRSTLASDRQQGEGEAWPEVASRIDRITGGATQRKSDAQTKAATK